MENIKLSTINHNKQLAEFSLEETPIIRMIARETTEETFLFVSKETIEECSELNSEELLKRIMASNEKIYFVKNEDSTDVLEIHEKLYNYLDQQLKEHNVKIDNLDEEEYLPIYFNEDTRILKVRTTKL